MTIKRLLLPAFALSLSALAMPHAHSHAQWAPNGLTPPRTDRSDIKSGPCGAARTDTPAVLQSGSTVTVSYLSTIFHNGDFRIAFSEANDMGFDGNVLADGIIDYRDEAERTHEITLPDVECDQCTLQLIQVMRDRNPPTNYYSCADITLVRGMADDTAPPDGVTNLTALPGDGQALLSWSNPNDEDFAGVLLLQQSTDISARPVDGESYTAGDAINEANVIFSGRSDNTTASGLVPGAPAHFAAFAYDHTLNYSAAVHTSVDVPQQTPNFAPRVTLEWMQLIHHTGEADNSGSSGEVVITAMVEDDNADDSHLYSWSSVDLPLADSDDDPAQFTFDPRGVESGLHEFRVTVTDDGESALSTTASVFIMFTPQPRGGGSGGKAAWTLLLSLVGLWALGRRQRSARSW